MPATNTAFAAALRQLARYEVGEPGATAYAQELAARDTDLEPCSAGIWIVTVDDQGDHRTFHVVEGDELSLVEVQLGCEICAECGRDRGDGASVEDSRTDTFRGTIGEVYLDGCASCVAFVKAHREAA